MEASRINVIQAFEPSNCLLRMTIVIESFRLFPFFNPASSVLTAPLGSHFPSLIGTGSLAWLAGIKPTDRMKLKSIRLEVTIALSIWTSSKALMPWSACLEIWQTVPKQTKAFSPFVNAFRNDQQTDFLGPLNDAKKHDNRKSITIERTSKTVATHSR